MFETFRGLLALKTSTERTHRDFADAYRATRAGRLSPTERARLDGIETLREELLNSDLEISYRDFGAGTPGDDLTREEMDRGRERTIVVRDVLRHGNLALRYRLLLFHLIRRLRPRTCIELGTSLGFSVAYQAAALRLNGLGHVVTLEGCENTAALARENLARLGLDSHVTVVIGRFQDTLTGVLAEHGPVEFGFIDGHHDGDATIGYFKQIVERCARDGVLVFDDIKWYESMKAAWQRMAEDPASSVAVDCDVVGAILLGRWWRRRSLLRLHG